MPTSAEGQVQDVAPNTVESVASTAADPPTREQPPKVTRRKVRPESSSKLMKRIESLQGKIEKLTECNKKLKEEQKRLKASYSRVHRIPKRTIAST